MCLSYTLIILTTIAVCYGASFNVEQNDPYRPQYHVMPEKNWMNDPNGPLYYKGYYHLFYQYTPAPVSGLKYWGHAVSKDLVYWQRLPLAISPDKPYDSGGIWTGSAAILPDGTPMVVYTGQTNVEVQCLAFPTNVSDPLLINWSKPSYNPVITNPPQGNTGNFRDPATPWQGGNRWYLVTGCTYNNQGAGLLWTSTDLRSWQFLHPIYTNNQFGSVWECPDFFAVPNQASLHIFKFSGNGQDHWVVGQYNTNTHTFAPSAGAPIAIASYGAYYASKNFFDPVQNRVINFGWIMEEDNGGPARGWQGLQSLPSEVTVDNEYHIPVVYPVKELGLLRKESQHWNNVPLKPDNFYTLNFTGNQLEIMASFDFSSNSPNAISYGIRILETPDKQTYTSIAFQQSPSSLSLAVDRSRSGSTGSRSTQGGNLPINPTLTSMDLRIFIDHSVVEVFAYLGRIRIVSRLYTPSNALGISLFSTVDKTAHVNVYNIGSIWNQ